MTHRYGVIVTVVWNGYGEPSSNLGRKFCISHSANAIGKVGIQLFSLLLVNSRTDWLFNLGMATGVSEGKFWISVTRLDDFYHSAFRDFCLHLYCYIHNVWAEMSSGLLLVFPVELGTLHGTLIHVFYLIHGRMLALIPLIITGF